MLCVCSRWGEPVHEDVTESDPLADWPGEALTADMDEEEFTAWISTYVEA
jgi:hypothetical protein